MMLSDYSSQALELILGALPDLQGLAEEREDYFEIETTCPAGWEFGVYSYEEQITVAFAEYHCHIGGYAESTVEQDVEEAVSLIRALRKEELVLAVWFRGDEYMGSYMLPPSEQPALVVSGPNQKVKIRKWIS
jgi:hypothetical protein